MVYRAHDARHDRTVAIKVLRGDIASTIGAARFDREIRLEARFQHPNIVPVYEWAQRDDIVFCVMPLIDGESLRDRLTREGQLPISDSVRITCEVAGALAYAHEHGVVHRDVKPENILLSSGHAMLTDFGIARVIGETASGRFTSAGMAVGTVAYMSPEQASADGTVGPASDLYALGCVLYEMLAGNPPFGSGTPLVVVARHMSEPPPPLQIARPTVPASIVATINRALEKVPADRFPSTMAFANALEWEHTPASTKAAEPRVRHGGRAWQIVAGLAFLATVALLAVWLRPGVLDDQRVVVFPLSTSFAANDAGAGTGWDVAIAIGASLEHAEPLRVIDGYSQLTAETRRDMRLLTASVSRGLSSERRARYYIDGAILRRNDTTDVVIRLHDASGDSLVAQETASGPSSESAATLGLRAVGRLLPRLLDPARRVDVPTLSSRAPAALALWIQGEREYRQSRFAPALDLFRRAVQEDSLLAIAAVRGAQAASWVSRLEEAEVFVQLALAHRDQLPARYAKFANGLRYYLTGNADSAASVLGSLAKVNHDDPESPMALAEVHMHLVGGPANVTDSIAEFWLTESVRRDSAFTPPLIHLAQVAYRRGAVAQGDALVASLRTHNADAAFLRQLDLMASCVRGQSVEWAITARVDPESVLAAAKELLAHFAQPGCAESALKALLQDQGTAPGVRWAALLHLQGLYVATRRNVALRALLDSTVLAGTTQARALYVIDAIAGADASLLRPRADESMRLAQASYGQNYERASAQTRWILALWHAFNGQTARLEAISAVSDSAAGNGGRREVLFAKALRAHVLLARGDTMGAIGAFEQLAPSARRDSLTYELFEPLGIERAILALALLKTGKSAEAIRVASLLEHPQPAIYLIFLPLSLQIRARASERLDNFGAAKQYTARLERLAVQGGTR